MTEPISNCERRSRQGPPPRKKRDHQRQQTQPCEPTHQDWRRTQGLRLPIAFPPCRRCIARYAEVRSTTNPRCGPQERSPIWFSWSHRSRTRLSVRTWDSNATECHRMPPNAVIHETTDNSLSEARLPHRASGRASSPPYNPAATVWHGRGTRHLSLVARGTSLTDVLAAAMRLPARHTVRHPTSDVPLTTKLGFHRLSASPSEQPRHSKKDEQSMAPEAETDPLHAITLGNTGSRSGTEIVLARTQT